MKSQQRNNVKLEQFNTQFKNFVQTLSCTRGFVCSEATLAPRLEDATATTSFDRDYLYHAAWASRRIAAINPPFHTDLASNLYLSAIISAFLPVRFYDYRPPDLHLSSLNVGFADLTKLPFDDEALPSISCLSVIEHIGLGRYGDPLDPDGDIKAVEEIKRVTTRGGSILINLPLGQTPTICFNAHRIYSKEQILNMFQGFKLIDFLFINRDCQFPAYTSTPSTEELGIYANGHYAAGCFHFIKDSN